MKPPTCHFDAERGWLSSEHLRDCAEHGCVGCRPCGKSHCALLGRCANHVDQAAGVYTCPACVGKVKHRVRRIADLYALVDLDVEARGLDIGPLIEQAGENGIDSEAFNLIGPAADPDQYAEQRRRMGARYERQGWCDWPRHERFHPDDPHHPYAVLGRWELACRESYGPQSELLINVGRAADYLTGPMLEMFAHTAEFEDFARETATCLSHLEGVLHDSREPERGAPCPPCRAEGPAARLVKHYAEHRRAGEEIKHGPLCHCGEDEAGHCRVCAGHEDTWHCPANAEHWWSDADYRNRVDGDYLEHATTLTASQIHEVYGVKPGALRKAAERDPRLRRGRNALGQQTYDVALVKALWDTAPIGA